VEDPSSGQSIRAKGCHYLSDGRLSTRNPQSATLGETVCIVMSSCKTRNHSIRKVGGRRDLIKGQRALNILTPRDLVSQGLECSQI
jgi:hypothetical protein